MSANRIGRRMSTIAGVACVISLAALSAACGNESNPAPITSTSSTPATTPTSPSTMPPPAPTEKSINPTGGNLFTPPIQAPAAPSVPAGRHPGINGVP